MLAVGLTGGIGSGKSTVADLLVERGAVLIDADQIARDVVAPGGPAYQPLIDRFGPGILAADGTIDRKALAALAFADEETRLELNAITHPAIGIAMIQARDALADGDDIVVLDIPLLTAAAPGDGQAARGGRGGLPRPTWPSSGCCPSAASTGPTPRPASASRSRGRSGSRTPTTSSTTRVTGRPWRPRWPRCGTGCRRPPRSSAAHA